MVMLDVHFEIIYIYIYIQICEVSISVRQRIEGYLLKSLMDSGIYNTAALPTLHHLSFLKAGA